MKSIILSAALVIALASCGTPATESSTTVDTTACDTTVCDTTDTLVSAADTTMTIDTTSVLADTTK